MEIWPGRWYPLGAAYDGTGTNFSLFSEAAERVELCLFDAAGSETRISLPEVTAHCWHAFLPGIEPGQRYGYRVHGPWAPERGALCNPHKLLLDPYAKAIEGGVRWSPAVFPFAPDGVPDAGDSAPCMPKGVVVNPFFEWGDDRPPRTPAHDTVIYEAHVKGISRTHPELPEALRGTYSGLAHPALVEHLKRLGVTAVELMPVHHFVHDGHLLERGLRNYWGYNSIGYFAPHDEYAATGRAGQQVAEFKAMVRTLHAAGIEVLLDVVYNHTAEGNHDGPMLSFKGIDNAAYYRTLPDDPSRYADYTGCGNSLNMRHPHVLQLIMDSLRYWILEMHVDGFRFDLAAALARELHEVDRLSAFFDLIHQDPVVSQVKLIAEPWDLGEGGYQVGNFPPGWHEWNGKYRDEVRDYWRGADQTLGSFASRLSGSPDLYGGSTRRPAASVNFVTAHDGLTLRDLVADDESLRPRQQRNLLATLFLSQGIPMLLAGDELGRTQRGNDNAFCHDDEISWIDWPAADEQLLAFTRGLIQLRAAEPVFRGRRWFRGEPVDGGGPKDIAWFRPDGSELQEQDWLTGFAKSLGVFLNGDADRATGPRGERIRGGSFYLIFNAHDAALAFRLPAAEYGAAWRAVLDTTEPSPRESDSLEAAGSEVKAGPRSLILLRRVSENPPSP